jgi:argininosuccinate lyase
MKLWQKETEAPANPIRDKIEAFTVGSDKQWDLCLAEADVEGSLAHAEMLCSIGLITEAELQDLKEGLAAIREQIANGTFVLEDGVEDVHSQIELMLTRSKGNVGKKVHSGRSRNDQSLLDIKLFIRKELFNISGKMAALFSVLQRLSDEHKDVFLPGYTHLQLAMPSSFGLWFGAYAESLDDDLELLIAAYNVANKNPLGSGAGYGSSFPLDRRQTTAALHFESMNYNVVYAQMTRGKTEKITAMALSSVAATLAKFSMDVCLYMNQQFGFISFPDELTTGSSIMPHKKNPDVFELIRAKCNRIQALPNELTLLISNLPSGYHRDLQLTKECLFPAIQELKSCLEMAVFMLQHITVRTDLALDDKFQPLFTVESVNKLVIKGIPFRDAYRMVAARIEDRTYRAGEHAPHTHEGSSGNLCNEEIRERFYRKLERLIPDRPKV